jgi:hypothetical protein
MSDWKVWLNKFLADWIDAFFKGIQDNEETIVEILRELSEIEIPGEDLVYLKKLWTKSDSYESLKQTLFSALESIENCDKDCENYLSKIFEILFRYLNPIELKYEKNLLKNCGVMCASRHTLDIFQKAKTETKSLQSFIDILNKKFKINNMYTLIDDNNIIAKYPKCYCPLVNAGFVKDSSLCNCSTEWLHYNLTSVLDRDIKIIRNGIVLEGKDECEFLIEMK